MVVFVGMEPNTRRVTPIRIMAVAKADVVMIFIIYQGVTLYRCSMVFSSIFEYCKGEKKKEINSIINTQ